MGQITRAFAEKMVADADYMVATGLTLHEQKQLAQAWLDRDDLRQQLAAAEGYKREPVAEFKADENGHITLRALDAWEGETGNLYYAHHPVPPEGAGHD